jgi:ABC-type transport system involved in multi-copper enzyme maturation permease subunit
MSTMVAQPRLPALKVTQARVMRSELTKFRTLRSTKWTLAIAVVLMTGIGALMSALQASQYHPAGRADPAAVHPIATSLEGALFAVVAFGTLGVLMMSGEYATGMVRASLTAVPRRLEVLWGKLAVFAGVTFAISLVTSFVSFYVGQAVLSSHHLNVAITAPGALRSVIGAALYLTVAGLTGVALGALFRNTAAGTSTFAGLFFVLPPLVMLLPASIASHVGPYLPSNAGDALWGGARQLSNPLAPWTGFALLCGYVVVIIGLAAWRLRRTDA